ncbi:MAG: hypothetical protein BWY92_01625 [Firmicutes bacterium ADurb.BinA052]|nr:MAG: hypothetical protein BWY92_01625 [Firmicutes bacterium ADurb.BinA052]
MRFPIGIAPLSIRWAPNQVIVISEMLSISMSNGIVSAISLLTLRAVEVRSRLAWSNRRASYSVFTNALMTRMPASFSRAT